MEPFPPDRVVLAGPVGRLVEVRGHPDPEHPPSRRGLLLVLLGRGRAPTRRGDEGDRRQGGEKLHVADHSATSFDSSDERSGTEPWLSWRLLPRRRNLLLRPVIRRVETRGSRASRSPSPSKLKASVVAKRNRPGNTIIHQATVKMAPASDSILPQDGVVGGTPIPRKDSAASNRMLFGMIKVVNTRTGAATFGRMSRVMILRLLAPAAAAASTNSFSRSRRTSPLTSREM